MRLAFGAVASVLAWGWGGCAVCTQCGTLRFREIKGRLSVEVDTGNPRISEAEEGDHHELMPVWVTE